MKIVIQAESPFSADAFALMAELSAELEALTGSGGALSFDAAHADCPRGVFAVARDEQGRAVGCGALRRLDDDTAEIKRVYARQKGAGVGSAVLEYLENQARQFGYSRLVLETRKVNKKAVAFYLAKGYKVIENFGKYRGREEAVCFEKRIKRL
jgi:GNAT superfamily N-acetyltransferase